MSFFEKLKKGMGKTRDSFSSKLNGLFAVFSHADEDFLEELEETLILCDLGMPTTESVMEELRERIKENRITEAPEVKEVLKSILKEKLEVEEPEDRYPKVVLMVGVNGVGKTTSIGKIANLYKQSGKTVLMAAADTFRAAASEQLEIWAKRVDVPIVKYGEGHDPSAVIYDALDSAKHKKIDVVICDTAGRLHNKKNLMSELEKINRVIEKSYPEAQRETLLVLDATTGQNAIVQAKEFASVAPVTGLVLTKLDGTAKGGFVFAVKDELKIPVRYIGVGEGMDDLQVFNSEEFAEALLD